MLQNRLEFGQVHPPVMASYVAVKIYGPGHVVAYNYIADFHDGIDVETYGNPDGIVASAPGMPDGPKYPPQEYWDRRPVAIDIYNNYITNSHDNAIETDGSMHNVRVLRNMFINHASAAFTSQPDYVGPYNIMNWWRRGELNSINKPLLYIGIYIIKYK
ncbi:MAG TPA: hypothetical protein EYQ00_06800, partial [Dehalococcoidia bacterium]|nr:hypothetical protein [Dehalococcoidia bacterium]